MPSGCVPGTAHRLQETQAILMALPFSQPTLDFFYLLTGFWAYQMGFHSSLLVSRNSPGNFKQEAVSWSSITQGRQGIMRSKMDDLLQLLFAHDHKVGEDGGGQHEKAFRIYRNSTLNTLVVSCDPVAFISLLVWSQIRLLTY